MPNIVHCFAYSCLIIILETVMLFFHSFSNISVCILLYYVVVYLLKSFGIFFCFFLNSKENKTWANLHKINGHFHDTILAFRQSWIGGGINSNNNNWASSEKFHWWLIVVDVVNDIDFFRFVRKTLQFVLQCNWTLNSYVHIKLDAPS